MRSKRVGILAVLCVTTWIFVGSAIGADEQVDSTSFKQLATLTPSDISGGTAQFGSSVAISGNTAVVGAPFANNGAGAVYVFVKPAGGWVSTTQTAELSASDSAAGIDFGGAVAISGNTIVVGSFAHNTAYVFTKPAGGWTDMTETARLSAATNTNGIADLFGANVAIDGPTIAVSAYQASFDRGRVDVFTEPKGGWVSGHPIGHLFAPDPKADGFFGSGLAIQGSTIVVGAPDGVGQSPGEVYVYVKPAAGWKGQHTNGAILTPSDGATVDDFGAVAINSNTVVAGAPGLNNNVGAAYVFVEPTSGWSNMNQTAKLTATNAVSDDFVGASVAIVGQTVVVGAQTNGGPGAVYTFDEPSGGWVNETQTSELTVAGSGELGTSVAMSGTTMIAGARDSGTAYIFGP
jgi:hypothetical protein